MFKEGYLDVCVDSFKAKGSQIWEVHTTASSQCNVLLWHNAAYVAVDKNAFIIGIYILKGTPLLAAIPLASAWPKILPV